MTGVWASSSVSICPAMLRWVDRSEDAMYCATRVLYWELLKWAAFQVPVPVVASFQHDT